MQSINGAGGTINLAGDKVTINEKVTIDSTGKISGVTDGTEPNDAVNYGQLKKVSDNSVNVDFTNISNNGKTEIVNIAKAADVHVKEGKYSVKADGTVTMTYVDGNGNEVTGNELKITDVASATKLNALNNTVTNIDGRVTTNSTNIKTLQGEVITSGSIGANGKVELTKKDGSKVEVGTVKDYSVTSGTYDQTTKKLTLTKTDAYGNATSGTVDIDLSGIQSGDKNWTAQANGTDVKPNAANKVNFINGDNTNVTTSGDGVIAVNLNKNLTGLNSVTTNNAYVTNVDKTDNHSVTNVQYVNEQIAGVTLTAGDGISISEKKIKVKLKDGEQNLVVDSNGLALNTALTGIESITGAGGTINLAGSAITINETTFNKDGRIQNVAEGTETKDAVNFGQLDATNKKVDNLTTEVGKGWTVATDNGTATKVGAGDTVKFSGADNNIKVSNDGTNVKVELNKELKGLNSVTTNNAYVTNVDASKGDSVTNVEYVKNQITDAALSAGNGISITDKKINVKLKDGEKNLVVDSNGLSLNTALTGIQSITGAGEGAGSISFADGGNVKVNDVTIEKGGKITGVAAGEDGTDAVNVSQLNKVSAAAKTEVVKGTNIASVGETTATDGHTVYTVNAKGTSVSVDGNFNLVETTDAATNVTNYGISLKDSVTIGGTHAVTINGTDGTVTGLTNTTWNKDSITSGRAATEDQLQAVATEAGKHTTLSNGKNTTVNPVTTADGHLEYKVDVNDELKDIKSIIGAGEGAGSISFADGGIKLNNKVTINKDGKITGVAAGEVSSTSTDAINGSQLHAVKTELQTSDKHLVGNPASADGYYKPDANGDISLRVEDQNKNGYDVVINDVASKAELGDVAKRVTNVENKVTQIETDITTIKTRVDNVEALAGKHTTLEKNGTNINVEETVVDGQKNYKVNLNKNITLGDENGNNVSISGTNGTITATGDITTANRINAANGGKLADIDVTGNKLSNGNSSITLDGTNVKVNDKVTVDKDGKISGVAKGDISNTSTDAVNGSQLYDTNTHITNVENQVISNSNRIGQLSSRVNKVGAGAAALAALHPMDFDPDDKLTFSAGYGNYGGENAAAIGAYYRPDEKVMFSVGGTVGNGENMVNAGISFALDRTNHVSNSRTALAREVIDLRGQLAVMGAKMAKMEKAFGMLDETKTKLFPDVPANHWAYEYIAKLAGNGYIEGYPDGNFGGDRLMTRYEFAAMLYRAIENGAALEEKIIKEFEPELGRIRVDRISGEDGDRDKIERVRVNDTKGERDHYGNKLAK